jgi:2-amino-4-ketopentanoate thiolase alpha subunit
VVAGTDHVAAGTRVQIRFTLLEPPERAPGLPADTAAVPYEGRVRGALVAPAAPGERATVRTATGRELSGTLEIVEPADLHTFGRPPRALVDAIEHIRPLLERLR